MAIPIRDQWQTIRDEALALQSIDAFEAVRTPGSVGYYDVGFRTFYECGWSKFYLKWYGTRHRSALRLCPKTLALLDQVPEIRGAMFSLLPAGAELSLHADPLARVGRSAPCLPRSHPCRNEHSASGHSDAGYTTFASSL